MPLIREINYPEGIRAGIWQITESASELKSMIDLGEPDQNLYNSFSHDLRKRHWLACRVLLRHMLDPAPYDIIYDNAGKPFLSSGSHHISFSHAGKYAAAVCCREFRVGVDIEQLRDRVERVRERFLLPGELEKIGTEKRLEQLYIYWCGKEALFKLAGSPVLDFRRDIYIHPFDYLCNPGRQCHATLKINNSLEEHRMYYEKIEDYMLVVAV